MKFLFIIMLSLFGFSKNKAQAKSIHSFKVEALDGSTIDFSKFKGKKIELLPKFLERFSNKKN